jgi:integrase
VLTIQRSKTDPLAHGEHVVIAAARDSQVCAVEAARRWCERVGEGPGVLLRAASAVHVINRALQPRTVSRIVQRLAASAGLGDVYSAHSLRAGLATSAYARGVSEQEIQKHGRWKTRRSLDRYIHVDAITNEFNLMSAFG